MNTEGATTEEDEVPAKRISRYTRAEALKGGTLVDITKTTREAGILLPVAVTAAVWHECVKLTPTAERVGNDEHGRLWDLAWMLRFGARQHANEREFLFEVLVVTDATTPTLVTLKAICGPGDQGEPVVTVLMQGED